MYDISELFQRKIMTEIAVFRDKLDNPSYRTIFPYRNHLVVVKRFGASKASAEFSIKLFRNPRHLVDTFARWNTNVRLTSDIEVHREIEFAFEQFNIFLVDAGCNPINDENPTD